MPRLVWGVILFVAVIRHIIYLQKSCLIWGPLANGISEWVLEAGESFLE